MAKTKKRRKTKPAASSSKRLHDLLLNVIGTLISAALVKILHLN